MNTNRNGSKGLLADDGVFQTFQSILNELYLRLNESAEIIETVGDVTSEVINALIQVGDAAVLKVDPEQIPDHDNGHLRPTDDCGIHLAMDSVSEQEGVMKTVWAAYGHE
jgi:hypothetical protein